MRHIIYITKYTHFFNSIFDEFDINVFLIEQPAIHIFSRNALWDLTKQTHTILLCFKILHLIFSRYWNICYLFVCIFQEGRIPCFILAWNNFCNMNILSYISRRHFSKKLVHAICYCHERKDALCLSASKICHWD